MKILIVGASRYDDDGSVVRRETIIFPRLSLMYLAGLTPEDDEVSIVDELVESIDFNVKYDLVAITAYTSQALRAYDIANKFREADTTVIMGGIHASALPDEALQHVDSVVIGEADYLWEEILDDCRNKRLKPTYKSTKLHDLKDMPVPRYDLVKKQYYIGDTLPVLATRGCPHNCEFCTVTKFFGNTYRVRPIDDVIHDIKMSGTKSFFFVDDNIIGNRRYAEELFKRLIPLNIKWSGQSTVTLGKFPDLCKLMAKSGCFSLVLGIESINQASLETVSKGHNKVTDYYKLLNTIKENGLCFQLSMILGFDEDDDTIFDQTLDFIYNTRPHLASLNVPIPYPGTIFTKKLDDEGRILHKDWSKYRIGNVVFKPKLLNAETLEIKNREAFKKLFNLRSIFRRCIDQPRRCMLRSFCVNLITRKFMLKDMWLSGG